MNMNNKRYMELSKYIFPIYSGGTIVGQGLVAEKEKTGIWLSEQMGHNIGTVSRWMTNKVQPSGRTIIRHRKAS